VPARKVPAHADCAYVAHGLAHRVAVTKTALMHCPSLNIFGTFFPSWLLCVLIGIVVAGIAYGVVSRTRFGGEIKPALLAYSSVALSVTFILWLALYGQ
jgi:hypothetical protein